MATTLVLHDDRWWCAFAGTEEPLLMQLDQNTRELRAGSDEAWQTDVDGEARTGHGAVSGTPCPPHGCGSNDHVYPVIYGPDGRYEYAAVHQVDIDPADVAVLARLVEDLRAALGTSLDLADLLQDVADHDPDLSDYRRDGDPAGWSSSPPPSAATGGRRRHRGAAAAAARPGRPHGADPSQEQAYRRFITRYLRASGADLLDRFGHLGR
ncbi:hypothetical protein GXW82_44390 [Streptacidiphilus sp. 4-A2]|nr:hypothetical protein [Streptacidiphilus sp. 4-A2]